MSAEKLGRCFDTLSKLIILGAQESCRSKRETAAQKVGQRERRRRSSRPISSLYSASRSPEPLDNTSCESLCFRQVRSLCSPLEGGVVLRDGHSSPSRRTTSSSGSVRRRPSCSLPPRSPLSPPTPPCSPLNRYHGVPTGFDPQADDSSRLGDRFQVSVRAFMIRIASFTHRCRKSRANCITWPQMRADRVRDRLAFVQEQIDRGSSADDISRLGGPFQVSIRALRGRIASCTHQCRNPRANPITWPRIRYA